MSTILTTTSTTRPAAVAGDTYFETDTNNIIVYDGTNWKSYQSDGTSSVSALKTGDSTWCYWDFADEDGTGTFGTANKFDNAATGASAIASANLARSSYAKGLTKCIYGATVSDVEVTLGGDPFDAATNGLSAGFLFQNRHTGSSSKGIFYYGDTSSGDHFFFRANFGAEGTIKLGEDSGSSDSWNTVTTSNTPFEWMFVVVTHATDGSLSVSINGANFTAIRTGGTAVSPDNAIVGLAGDPYGDNSSSHSFGVCFFYKGVLTQSQVNAEYAHLKLRFPECNLP